LSSDFHYLELENALSKIKYDVLGLCVKRTGNETIEVNGNIFHYIGYNNRRGSVGFVIKSKWKNNIKIFKDFSDRVTAVVLELNAKETLAIIQVYSPTSAASRDSKFSHFFHFRECENQKVSFSHIFAKMRK
jgi:hypothetical protein